MQNLFIRISVWIFFNAAMFYSLLKQYIVNISCIQLFLKILLKFRLCRYLNIFGFIVDGHMYFINVVIRGVCLIQRQIYDYIVYLIACMAGADAC